MTKDALKICQRALVRRQVELEDHIEKCANLESLLDNCKEELQQICNALEEIESELY